MYKLHEQIKSHKRVIPKVEALLFNSLSKPFDGIDNCASTPNAHHPDEKLVNEVSHFFGKPGVSGYMVVNCSSASQLLGGLHRHGSTAVSKVLSDIFHQLRAADNKNSRPVIVKCLFSGPAPA